MHKADGSHMLISASSQNHTNNSKRIEGIQFCVFIQKQEIRRRDDSRRDCQQNLEGWKIDG